jgi:hypothetical protein
MFRAVYPVIYNVCCLRRLDRRLTLFCVIRHGELTDSFIPIVRELKKRGVPEDKLDLYIETVNDIGNLQLLAAQLNEEKLTTDFDVWFAEQYKTDADKIQYRTINMLPDMEYSYENFLQFVEQRKAKLKAELIKILL